MQRSVCIVPGCCNSSAKFAGYRYICGPHWRRIPRWLKRADRLLIRELRRAGLIRGDDPVTWDARQALNQSWNALERAAIEAAAGL